MMLEIITAVLNVSVQPNNITLCIYYMCVVCVLGDLLIAHKTRAVNV